MSWKMVLYIVKYWLNHISNQFRVTAFSNLDMKIEYYLENKDGF